MRRSFFAALALSALAGCSSTSSTPSLTISSAGITTSSTPLPGASAAGPSGPTDPLAQLAAFTLADLQAADADAKAQTPPDVTASQCYDFLIAVIPTIQLPNGAQTVGAVMAFQRLRDINNGIGASGGIMKSLNLACAPLVIDTQTTVNRLVAIGGGVAAGASVGLPLLPLP
jgi:Prokaryotic membrane lipoprotein lipid attachment site